MTKLRQDWLEKDFANVKAVELLAKLPRLDLPQLLNDLKPVDIRVDRSLGFGFRQLNLAKYGGYSTLWISILVSNSKIVALQCFQAGSDESWSEVSRQVMQKTKLAPAERDKEQIVWIRYIDQAAIDKATKESLGNAPAVPSGKLQHAFNTLNTPFETLTVGEKCGYAGEAPEGKNAVDELCAATRFDLVKAVLRGVSPEGRTYAAMALIKNHKIDESDLKVIDIIRKANVPISTCSGCETRDGNFDDFVHLPAGK